MNTTLAPSRPFAPSSLLGIPPRTRAESLDPRPPVEVQPAAPIVRAVLPPPAPERLHDWSAYWAGPTYLLIGVSLLNWLVFSLFLENTPWTAVFLCWVVGVGFLIRGIQVLQNSRTLLLRQRAWIRKSRASTL